MPALALGISPTFQLKAPTSYITKVLNLDAANLVAYWPMNETSGTEATDLSGNDYHGQYTNTPTLADDAGPHGDNVPLFTAANTEHVDLTGPFQTNRLRDVDSDLGISLGSEGTMAAWLRVAAAAQWTDATNYLMGIIRYNSSDQIYIKGIDAAASQTAFRRVAGGTQRNLNHSVPGATTEWFFVAQTWSEAANEFKAYWREYGGSLTAVGTQVADAWTGLDYRDSFAAAFAPPAAASCWDGHMFGMGLWSTPLSQATIEEMSTI